MTGPELLTLPVWLDSSRFEPIVGRGAEKGAIDHAWDGVMSSRRQVVLIGGPPGIGKSRLLAELGTTAHGAGALVLHGMCYADYGRPFQPFVDMLDHLQKGSQTIESLDEIGNASGRLLEFLRPSREVVVERRSTGELQTLFEAFAQIFEMASEIAPTVIAIDDIHWASVPTLDLIGYLVRRLGSHKALIAVTFRTTLPERTDALTGAVVDLYRQPGVIRLDLEGLTTSEIAGFLTQRIGRSDRSVSAAASVLRDWTGGNPFYLNETWRAVIEKDRWVAADLPASIGDAVRRRISEFTSEAREVIFASALSTDGVKAPVVANVLDVDVDSAWEALDQAVSVNVMSGPVDDRYFFGHDLARQALLKEIPRSKRVRHHARYARVLAEQFENDPTLASRLAHHYAEAGDHPSEALRFGVLAGELAESSLAFEEAASRFERAASFAQQKGEGEQLLLRSAGNFVRAGNFEHALNLYSMVYHSSDPLHRAKAAIGFADAMWRPGRLGHEAVAKLTGALEHLPSDADPLVQVELQVYMSLALGFAGAYDAALAAGEKALVAARRVDEPELLVKALVYPIYTTPVVSVENLERVKEAVALAAHIGDVELMAQTAFTRGTSAYVLGEHDEWQTAVETLALLADGAGQPFHKVAHLNAAAAISFCRGDYETALATTDQTLEHADEFGADRIEGMHGAATFMIRRETGLDEIRPFITGVPATEVGRWQPGLLAVYTELEMKGPARMILNELMSSTTATDAAGRYEGAQAVFLTEAVALLEERHHAEQLYHILVERSGTNFLFGHFINVFGSADRYLAMLAAVLGRDATEHFELALEMDSRMGSTHHRAETSARYAAYLRAIDPSRAAQLAEHALEVGRLMGSSRIQRIAGPQTNSADFRLTARELEVLELVSRGHSNREISDELFISYNTAANHVRNILIKTGSHNRTQAARYAADRDLI